MNTSPDFLPARRIHHALTAPAERRLLLWIAPRLPLALSSDALTLLGLLAQLAAGLFYALAHFDRHFLWLVILCIALNWFGDSLDGTVARLRRQERPRYGFYVDHMVDLLGSVALMSGLALSSLLHWPVAIAMLLGFLLLAAESYLATHTLSEFQLSQGPFGPTEIRLLLIAGNLALLRSPFCTVFGHRMLLFDLGGTVAALSMALMLVVVTCRNTARLFRAEPLARTPQPTPRTSTTAPRETHA